MLSRGSVSIALSCSSPFSQAQHDLQLPLHNQRPAPDNLPLPIHDDDDVIGIVPLGHEIIMPIPAGFVDIAYGGEDTEHVEEAGGVIGALQGADGVGFWEGGGDGGGNKGGEEEGPAGGGGSGVGAGWGPHWGRGWGFYVVEVVGRLEGMEEVKKRVRERERQSIGL